MPSLHHTGLTISNLERSLRFWRDAMGMTVVVDQEKKGGYLEAIVASRAHMSAWCTWPSAAKARELSFLNT